MVQRTGNFPVHWTRAASGLGLNCGIYDLNSGGQVSIAESWSRKSFRADPKMAK